MLSVLMMAVLTAPAQQLAPLPLHRLDAPITVDGRPDEPAWQAVPPLPLTLYAPVYRGAPTQRTEIRVAYDDDALYAAGWFFDDDAGDIRINSLYRDRWNGDDAFAIYVDAFNDNRSAKWFGITPAGMRFDLLVSDDGASLNGSWDGFWQTRTTVTSDGWFAEVRIPFSTLGFRADAAGDAIMGLTVTRLVSRLGERVTFPDIDPRFEFRQPSQAHDIVLRGVSTGTPVYVSPYALLGHARATRLGAGGTDLVRGSEPHREAGLDPRWGLPPSLTLAATVHTDFAQVEADDQQVNLDRFSLFFPEKRRFFQEGSGIFEFTTGTANRVFHSRRIGLVDERPVPVHGGARLVGRAGAWDVGLIGMRTGALGELPGESFGVARLRHGVLNPYSWLGGIATLRDAPGRTNAVIGMDGQLRVTGDEYITFAASGSHDTADPDDATPADRTQLLLQWQRRSTRGLWYNLRLMRAGRAYEPAVGYMQRRDITFFNAATNYYIFTDDSRTWRRVHPGLVVLGNIRNDDGVLESGRIATWLQVETKGLSGGWVEPQIFREDVRAPFRIAGAIDVPAGRYTFANIWLNWYMNAGKPLRTDFDLQVGSYFDGTRTQLILAPTWNASPHLELGAEYVGNRLDFPVRDQHATIHLARLRIRTALDGRASGTAFVQFNSLTDRVEANVRLRYNFAEGTDLWIVYDEGLATERNPIDDGPRLPLSVSRGLIVKYTKTFAW